MSAEIPGQVSEREIVEANEAVVAERDRLLRENRILRRVNRELEKCVRLYADRSNWDVSPGYAWSDEEYEDVWNKTSHGYEPAQACQLRVEEIKKGK